MPERKKMDIGFNRKVRAQWLTETLRLVAAGVSRADIENSLKGQIAIENAGSETIRKVFIYLNRIWLQPPAYCQGLRDAAVELFRSRPDSDSAFLLNWGMCIAAYPFIGHVAEATGRLLRVQGSAGAQQVNVRLRERFGDRHFIHRSVRYNLSTFLDIGALKDGDRVGTYIRGRSLVPRTSTELSWLVEALLHAQDDATMPLPMINVHGALFPFVMSELSQESLKANPRLDVFRHGQSALLITLKDGIGSLQNRKLH